MKHIILLMLCVSIVFIQVVACDNKSDTNIESNSTTCVSEEQCWLPMKYYVHSSMELKGICSDLNELTSIPIMYGSYISAEDWGSSNYTAKIILESDGVKLERSELILENFIGEEYQAGKIYYIPFTDETIYKDVGKINMKLQRTNDDGSDTTIFEYTMYYAVKDKKVYIDENSFKVEKFISDGCIKYWRELESELSVTEKIWIEQNTDVLYLAKIYQEKYKFDMNVEKYTYERTEDGKYVVKDDGGNQVFTLTEVEFGLAASDDRYFTQELTE